MALSANAVYGSSAPYSRRTTLLISVDAASGCGSGPGSIKTTACPRLRSSMAAVTPKTPAPVTRTRSIRGRVAQRASAVKRSALHLARLVGGRCLQGQPYTPSPRERRRTRCDSRFKYELRGLDWLFQDRK